MTDKKWSQMSPHELLDRAQAEFDSYEYVSGTIPTITAPALTKAQILLAAAQVQATENLAWTLQNRTSIGSPEMPTGWTPTP